MSELDIIRDLAKQALTITTPNCKVDGFLWDRAQRLVRNVEHICRLPEVAKDELQIDHFALITATYFSEAGLARHLESEVTGVEGANSNNNNEDLLDLATLIVEETLSPAASRMSISKINRIITESMSHSPTILEAMILSDARNLDDMGAVGIFGEFKRYIIGGKGVSNVLHTWKRKIEYKYWQTRLKESFRFESVRKIAEQRLSTAEYFLNQLKVENTASDLEELSIDSAID